MPRPLGRGASLFLSALLNSITGGERMQNRLLKGLWRYLVPVPQPIWQKKLSQHAGKIRKEIRFMTPDHHRVRNFVVTELPRVGKPLSPGYISAQLNMPIEGVTRFLDELEAHMTFLFRNPQGEVTWAYPVTVERTPHRVSFSTGEEIFAA